MDTPENERQYSVVDQMLSMHALLRDSYTRRAFLLKTGLIVASITLCAFVFASDKVLSTIGVQPDRARIGLGLASVAVLILSIIELRVDWEAAASRHAEAAKTIAALKAKYRKLYSETQGSDPKKNARLGREYERVMKDIPPIPDRKFNSLKATHYFKKLLSQRISEHQKLPAWFLGPQLRWEGLKDTWRRKEPGSVNTIGQEPNSASK